jgi:thioredoxin-dependent peroxiredoxin
MHTPTLSRISSHPEDIMQTWMKWSLKSIAIAAAITASVNAAHAQDSLKVGDPAPVFSATADNGKVWRSEDHVGKKTLVVYFYPAAMSGGCTKQACGFRDLQTDLTKLGATVVGVSGDRVQNLKYFKQADRLNFPLLSDTSGAVARAFGVPESEGGTIKRKVKGKEVELTRDRTEERWTFVIGKDGKIAMIETDVNAEGDASGISAAIQKMGGR